MLMRSSREHDFALWMSELAERSSCDIEWYANFGAEHGGGHVNGLDIMQYPWSKPDLVIRRVILSHGLCYSAHVSMQY